MATNNREAAGVGLAVIGFVILVGGFKGTWANVWNALWKSGGQSFSKSSTGSSAAPGSSGIPGYIPTQGAPGTPQYQVPVDPRKGGGYAVSLVIPPGFPASRTVYPASALV